MRLIVHGQQAFGKAVLEALLQRDEQVVAVYCAPDSGSRIDPLKEYALEQELRVLQPKSYRKPEVWEQMAALDADLCVMAYVTLFVPEEALNVPKLGSIQYHPSLLPMHKGPSSINWPIIFGEKKTGLSIFWPDNGLDTGPILLQKEVAIGEEDTLGTLYFKQLFPLGVAAMLEAVDLIRDGKAKRIPQDPEAGSYEGWCRAEDAAIDWQQPLASVYNLIRGTNPQPGAWTLCNDTKLQVFDCQKLDSTGGMPGEIIRITDAGIAVATADEQVLLQRVRAEGAAKQSAAEFAANADIAAGMRLG